MNTVIKDNETRSIEAGNRAITVHKGDEVKRVAQGNLTENIAKARGTTANTVSVQALAGDAGPGKQSYQATDEIEHRVGESVVTLKPDSIRLTHGASTILINGSGIYIDGPVIHLNQGTSASASAAPAAAGATSAGVASSVMKTGLGDDVDKLAGKSPSLQADMKKLKDDGWKIKYGAPGGGSFAIRGEDQAIMLDGHLKGNTAATTQTLAHEVGHAIYPFKADFSSKAAYVNGTLADEGAATMNNIKVQREILANGGQDIDIAGNSTNHATYNKAYDQFLKDGNAEAARQAIGAQFGKGEITSNTHQPYAEYYGSAYEKSFPSKK